MASQLEALSAVDSQILAMPVLYKNEILDELDGDCLCCSWSHWGCLNSCWYICCNKPDRVDNCMQSEASWNQLNLVKPRTGIKGSILLLKLEWLEIQRYWQKFASEAQAVATATSEWYKVLILCPRNMLIVPASEIDYTAVGTSVATLSSNLTELVTGM